MNVNFKNTNINLFFSKSLLIHVFLIISFISSADAQSTNQNFPTPITGNEISGEIPARDIGDARLTNYFYTFNGNQGDIFINVVTSNLNGDIDVFTADNLKPLTKITIYSDVSQNETGRVIYLRKPEKLVLRIEGRTPNDDPATFRIKFAGSFAPARMLAENETPAMPEVKNEVQSDVRVNSVGTIIEVKPKSPPKEVIAANEPKTKRSKRKTIAKKPEENTIEKVDGENKNQSAVEEKQIVVTIKEEEPAAETKKEKPEVQAPPATKIIVTDETADQSVAEVVNPKSSNENNKINETAEKRDETSEAENTKTAIKSKTKRESRKTKEPNPLENIRLIVLFKDGTRIERPMSEVLRMNVDKGILTIITKEGKIGRYSILDVEKMTIE